MEVFHKLVLVVDNGHGPAAENVARAHHDRIAHLFGNHYGLVEAHGSAVGCLLQAKLVYECLEALAVFRAVNGVRGGAKDVHACAHEGHCEVQGCLAAELDNNALGLFLFDDVHHILEGQGLKEEPVRGVVVRGYCLGVGVDHDGRDALSPQGKGRVAAAVVELYALAYAVGAAAKDDHLALVADLDFLAGLVGGVVVGRVGLEFACARIHKVVGGHNAQGFAQPAHIRFRTFPHFRQLPVGKAVFLGPAHEPRQFVIQGGHVVAKAEVADLVFHIHDVADLAQEPGIDACVFVYFLNAHAQEQGVTDAEDAPGVRGTKALYDIFFCRKFGSEVEAKAGGSDFHGAQALLQGFLEGAANAHGLAHALHGGGELVLCAREFFEGKAGNLDYTVVDGRLEARCRFPRDIVAQLVQGVAYGEFRGNLGNGETGRLGGQGRGARHPGVHFDDDHVAVCGVDAELNVGATGLDTDFAHDGNACVAHALVFDVREGLHRGHGDGIASVHAHGIEVFDGADNDDVVVLVAHDLHLHFLPAYDALFDHDFGNRACGQALLGHDLEVLEVVGYAAACAAKREGRAHNEREGQGFPEPAHIVHVVGNAALGNLETYALHGFAEELAALGLLDDVGLGANELDTVLFEHAALVEAQGSVQGCLAAKGGQDGVRALLFHNGRERVRLDGLDVRGVCHVRIGHDGCGIGVHKNDSVPLFLEGLDCL